MPPFPSAAAQEEEDEPRVPSRVVIREIVEPPAAAAAAPRGSNGGAPAHAKAPAPAGDAFMPLSSGAAPPRGGKAAAAAAAAATDASVPQQGKKRAAASAAAPTAAAAAALPAQPPAKKAAVAAPGGGKAAAAPAAAAAAATPAKPGSQFVDGPKGTLGKRTFDNGLEVISVSSGPPEGKAALPGKRVSMQYTGRLKSNNKVFDASKGRPFTFRLGVGEVIKAWDVGVKGMRVGDKRQLVCPPALAYGSRGAPPDIPPNAWLIFDVELVNVIDR